MWKLIFTTKVYKSQRWMYHWFSQGQTIKPTSRGLAVQVIDTVTHKKNLNVCLIASFYCTRTLFFPRTYVQYVIPVGNVYAHTFTVA